jgi:hypothetical protein
MSQVWAWISAGVIPLCILDLLSYGKSERQAYWAARGVVAHHAAAQPVERSLYGHLSR